MSHTRTLPTGWRKNSESSKWQALRDLEGFNGKPVLSLSCAERLTDNDGWANLSTSFKADNYRDRRVRFTALIRTELLEGWAGLWMRVDGPDARLTGRNLGFDNMADRGVEGISPFARYAIVLDVPAEAEVILLGLVVHGAGSTFFCDPAVEIVSTDVPTTGQGLPSLEPNLDFSR